MCQPSPRAPPRAAQGGGDGHADRRRPPGWTRVGNAYARKEYARDWLPFIRASWRYLFRVRVSQCTLRLVDGVPDERSRLVLDRKFNLDVPGPQAKGTEACASAREGRAT